MWLSGQGSDVDTDLDARRERRYRDGVATVLTFGRYSAGTGIIVDVSSGGLRLRTAAAVRPGQRVSCRVSFSEGTEFLRMRVVWRRVQRPGEDAELGLRYEPQLPGTWHFLENYLMRVLGRAA